MVITTLGPAGTYSEIAAKAFSRRFGTDAPKITFNTIPECLRAVQNRKADYAVIPIENVIDGIIGPTVDSLIDFHDFVKVCDEVNIPITHVLASSKGMVLSRVKKVYSHPSAINQCAATLSELIPDAEHIAVASTAEAARLASEDAESSAAVCSRDAVDKFGLTILHPEIQDYKQNVTRFVVAGLTDGTPTGDDRTLMAVRYGSDRPGLLFQIVKEFGERGINLTFVQSRPYKIRPHEYVLVFEFVGHKSDKTVEQCLTAIEKWVRELDGWKKVIGSYPRRGMETI